ncbi:hypothetical protein [Photorhabdus khanii]|uniref:hypothetical protein n=1 Tax=Photorhabdus khanii TaxID=1004150 RepID=UPI0039C130CB
MAHQLPLTIPRKMAFPAFGISHFVGTHRIIKAVVITGSLLQWRGFTDRPPKFIVSQRRLGAIRPEDNSEPVGIILVLPAGLVAVGI